jgi:hypothetical protein
LNDEDPTTFVGFQTKIDEATRIVGESTQAAETTTTTLRTQQETAFKAKCEDL